MEADLRNDCEHVMDIGSRLELLVDRYLIDRLGGGAARRLHNPVPREVCLVRNAPWEGSGSGYTTVFQDDSRYRMYYRACNSIYKHGSVEDTNDEVVCYAESDDGIHWSKPDLGLVSFRGSTANNIVWEGTGSHCFAPFRDTNPLCPPKEAYKAVGRTKGKRELHAFASPDGLHWRLVQDAPVITDGAFDSLNVAFWDAPRNEYRAYIRDFRNGRDVKTCGSTDFVHWTDPVWLSYTPGRSGELYTNNVLPYYRAPHIFVGFPTRYVDHGWSESTKRLPQREYRELVASSSERSGTAFSDSMFMSARSPARFEIWPESFIRPGIQRPGSWFYGDTYQNWGVVETESVFQDAPGELSFYLNEAARQPFGSRLRRYTLRVDGFVSVYAPMSGGTLLTKPFTFSGSTLELNVSTSAGGSVVVEVQDANGHPIEGFSAADCCPVYGDELARTVVWQDGKSLRPLCGTPVRLRFVLQDADLYALRFSQ
jgi:hypothetical protein